jgi:hypothetical protein
MEEIDKPTELTISDIDKFVKTLMNSEIPIHKCLKCSKEFIGGFGVEIGYCDQCYFDQFPKEVVEKFIQSFF